MAKQLPFGLLVLVAFMFVSFAIALDDTAPVTVAYYPKTNYPLSNSYNVYIAGDAGAFLFFEEEIDAKIMHSSGVWEIVEKEYFFQLEAGEMMVNEDPFNGTSASIAHGSVHLYSTDVVRIVYLLKSLIFGFLLGSPVAWIVMYLFSKFYP